MVTLQCQLFQMKEEQFPSFFCLQFTKMTNAAVQSANAKPRVSLLGLNDVDTHLMPSWKNQFLLQVPVLRIVVIIVVTNPSNSLFSVYFISCTKHHTL